MVSWLLIPNRSALTVFEDLDFSMSIHDEDRVVGGVGECPIAALALKQRGLSCLAIGVMSR